MRPGVPPSGSRALPRASCRVAASESEIAEIAAEIRSPSYRVNVSAAGFHVYNRDGMTTATDPYDLYPRLDLLQGDAACVLPGGGARAGADRLASASVMYSTSRSNGAVPCVPRRPMTPQPARRGHHLEGRQ